LPVGIQFQGKMGGDGALLSIARVFEHVNL